MYCDVQVINGLIVFADMRDYSLYEKEAHELANPVRSSGKRVSVKLFDPSGNFFPKKKTALSGLPKHAPYGFEKTQRLKSSVHPYLRQRKPAPFRFRGLRSCPENYISAVSLFLSPIEPTSLGFDGDPVKAASRSRHSPEPDGHGRGLCWLVPGCTLRPALPFAGRSCAWSAASRRFPHTRAHTAHRAAGS